jgi:hypothetical protein
VSCPGVVSKIVVSRDGKGGGAVKQVLLIPVGTIEPEDKKALFKAGWCAVEVQDPSSVVAVLPGGVKIRGDALLEAALEAIQADDTVFGTRPRFGALLIKKLLAGKEAGK